MIWLAAMGLGAGVVALVAFALRFGAVCDELATNRAAVFDRDRALKTANAELEKMETAHSERIKELIKKINSLEAEISTRRRPGDARRRLSGLLQDPEASDSDSD